MNSLIKICGDWGLGIGDWGLGIGDWAQSPIPIPNPLHQEMNVCEKITKLVDITK